MRKIREFWSISGKCAKVYRNVEWNEFVVRWFGPTGTHLDASDYFTGDKLDAMLTAAHSIEEEDKAYKQEMYDAAYHVRAPN